jgi:RHS repeat-associated protein
VTDLIYDGFNPIRESAGTGAVDLLTGIEIDEYLARTTTEGTEYFLTDGLGSTVALTTGGGTLATEYSYEPFGAVSATGTASGNELKYTGREDDGTGTYYYRARYYQPTLQRFVSEDPIGLAAGDFNFYAYVANDPLGRRDPRGLQAVPIPAPVPIPPPPVFFPGTSENDAFAQATARFLEAAGEAIRGILTSLLQPHDHLPTCVRLYELCIQHRWRGRCDDCLHFCRAQGYWPFNRCRPPRPCDPDE